MSPKVRSVEMYARLRMEREGGLQKLLYKKLDKMIQEEEMIIIEVELGKKSQI